MSELAFLSATAIASRIRNRELGCEEVLRHYLDRVDRYKDQVPMGRGGSAEEVAETIMWLLSDNSSYVTGAILDVSGGR